MKIAVKRGAVLVRPEMDSLLESVQPVRVVKGFVVEAERYEDDEYGNISYEFEYGGTKYAVMWEDVVELGTWWSRLLHFFSGE